MVKRTIQNQNGSYFTVIPRALVEALNLKTGDKVSFGIDGGKITFAPVETSPKTTTGAAASTKEMPA